MRILFITDSFPYPPISGDRIRVYNLLRNISQHHEVWLAALTAGPEEVAGISHMRTFCAGVITATEERRHPLMHLPGLLRYAIMGLPLELKFQYSHSLARQIEKLASDVEFDVVQIENSYLALYLEIAGLDRARVRILDLPNVVGDQYRRIADTQSGLSRWRSRLFSLMMLRWEPRYAENFDRCLAVSEPDRALLAAANPNLRVDVVPNGVDCERFRPLGEPQSPAALLFVGTMSYAACADGVKFFCDEVLPRIRRSLPNVEVWVVGADPPDDIVALDGKGIHVTGRVPDVMPYYRLCAASIVPLRAGGGTRLKILEAMALGRPVVSSTLGCEGLDLVDGEHLMIADDAEGMSDQCVRLLTDRTLRDRLVSAARERVVEEYGWPLIASRLLRIYAESAGGSESPGRHVS